MKVFVKGYGIGDIVDSACDSKTGRIGYAVKVDGKVKLFQKSMIQTLNAPPPDFFDKARTVYKEQDSISRKRWNMSQHGVSPVYRTRKGQKSEPITELQKQILAYYNIPVDSVEIKGEKVKVSKPAKAKKPAPKKPLKKLTKVAASVAKKPVKKVVKKKIQRRQAQASLFPL